MKQVEEVAPCIIVCGEGRNDLQEVTCTEYSSSRLMLGTLWRSDEIKICGSQWEAFLKGHGLLIRSSPLNYPQPPSIFSMASTKLKFQVFLAMTIDIGHFFELCKHW